jgi:hypothetical protein
MIDMILIERCSIVRSKKLDPQGGRVERSAVATTKPLKGGTEPNKKLAALAGLVPILHCGEISNVAFLY